MVHPADLLQSPPRRNGRPWLAGGVVVLIGLGVWSLERTTGSDPAPPPPVTLPGPVTATDQPTPTASPYLQAAAFVDERVGFGLQIACAAGATGPCPFRLVATTDGGASWDVRGDVPLQTGDPMALVPRSAQDISLVESDTVVVRSTDGGYHWSRLDVAVGLPAPAPPGAVIVRDPDPSSTRFGRTGGLSWLDLDTRQRHGLQTPTPVAVNLDFLRPTSAAGGDLILTGVTYRSARTAMSTDGGVSWVESSFATDAAVDDATPFAVGQGRAFVFVQSGGMTYLYRTDDGGVSWADLTATQPGSGWTPYAVVGGELIGVDRYGQVLIGADGGTRWPVVQDAPTLGRILPAVAGGPLVGEGYSGAPMQIYLSRDGLTWAPLRLPVG